MWVFVDQQEIKDPIWDMLGTRPDSPFVNPDCVLKTRSWKETEDTTILPQCNICLNQGGLGARGYDAQSQ